MELRHIVAAVDGAECSGAVLALAVDLARRHGARLTGLFIVD
ncbi:MAG: universal stress protein, partial [Actinomycetota bacterium]